MGSLGPAAMTNYSLSSTANSHGKQQKQQQEKSYTFKMPLHYPRYGKSDYETMPEWKLDCLLQDYGLPVLGGVDDKRKFAMGAFLWSH